MNRTITIGLLLALLLVSGCEVNKTESPEIRADYTNAPTEVKESNASREESYMHVKTSDPIKDIIHNPAFDGFGDFILPLERGYDENMPLSSVASLLPYHGYVNPEGAADTINAMLDEVAAGHKIFYDIYTAAQKQADPTKEKTGFFFFRGEPGAPFAIICPGGGFAYVGSIHEGFPLAIELSNQGYNALVIQYRVGSSKAACEDLAAAVTLVFRNAEELQVSKENYSLWGGSAGARMAAYLGSYGPAEYGGDDLSRPGAVIMAYTGHTDYTENDPPTFVVVSENDPIASAVIMERRVNALRKAGIDVELRKYRTAGHGFGLGIGTDAEGWIEYAVKFWEKHMK